MAKRSVLERMRSNPRADWTISDIEKLCADIDMELIPPSSGSHYKICSEYLRDILTIPARRPIKAPYIRKLVSYADAHRELRETRDD